MEFFVEGIQARTQAFGALAVGNRLAALVPVNSRPYPSKFLCRVIRPPSRSYVRRIPGLTRYSTTGTEQSTGGIKYTSKNFQANTDHPFRKPAFF